MTLREIMEISVDIDYNIIFCHDGNFYEKVYEDLTEEEFDNSELTTISEVDGKTTFYFNV